MKRSKHRLGREYHEIHADSEGARIAIVTPWFGPDLRGGAEQQSWQLAHELVAIGRHVDVLTTACSSFTDDWSRNGLRPGAQTDGRLTVRRFRVAKRDRRAFDRVNAILLSLRPEQLKPAVEPIGEDDAATFYQNGINSPPLYEFLREHGERYARIIFLPYLYGPTIFGLPIVAERAYLQPCLHDEAYAYLGRISEIVHAAKRLLLNSEGEYELALRLFGPGIAHKSTIVGEGVESLAGVGRFPERIGAFEPAKERYALYVGRQDPAKGVPSLVRAFVDFKRRHPTSSMKLVLAGERTVTYGDRARDIIDLGPVGEPEKAALLEHCRILMQPSTNESFSRVIYEAWLHGRPVAVHSDCLATATAVRLSNGGYLADSAPAWEDLFAEIERASHAELAAYGARGQSYARSVAAWPNVIDRYKSVFAPERTEAGVPLHQDVPPNKVAKAYAGQLADTWDRNGWAGELVAGGLTIRHIVGYGGAAIGAQEIAIYHAGTDVAPSRNGTSEIDTDRAFASTVTALETVRSHGRSNVELLPFPIDPIVWDAVPDRSLVAALQDNKHNLLYDGPITDIGHLNDLLVVFLHYLTIEREARLIVCASLDCDEAIFAQLAGEIARLELGDIVILARELEQQQRNAIYRTAHAFISLDPSDTPCIGLLRALWFDIPIVALASPTARALLGEAIVILRETNDPLAIASLANMIVTDRELRAACIRAQREARERIGSHRVVHQLLEIARRGRVGMMANEHA